MSLREIAAPFRVRRPQRAAAAALCLVLVLGLGSCRKRRLEPTAPSAPVAAPLPAPPSPSSGPVSVPQTRTEPPPAQPIPEGAAPPAPGPLATIEPESKPSAGKPAASKPPAPPQATPAAPPAGSAAAPSEAPKLSPMLSPAQRRAYNREIDESVARARRLLADLPAESLNRDRRAAVKRIRAFIRQAEESRAQDPALARNLAQRARLLAEDLARNPP